MPDVTSERMRAAAELLREQEAQLEGAKTLLYQQELALKEERHSINVRLNDIVQARHALDYKAGEQERMGSNGEPSEAVSALIEAAIASAVPGTVSAEVNAGA